MGRGPAPRALDAVGSVHAEPTRAYRRSHDSDHHRNERGPAGRRGAAVDVARRRTRRRGRRHRCRLGVGLRGDPGDRRLLRPRSPRPRPAAGGAALGLALAARRTWVRPSPRAWALVTVCGVAWFAGYNIALNAAEQRLDAGTAAMLVNVGPVLIAVLAGVVLREGFSRWLLAGLAVAFVGAAVIGFATSRGAGADPVGVLLCLLAALGWAVGVLAQKQRPARRRRSARDRVPRRTRRGRASGRGRCAPYAARAGSPRGAPVRTTSRARSASGCWTGSCARSASTCATVSR